MTARRFTVALALALAAGAPAPAAAKPPPLSFDVITVSRFGGDADGDGVLDRTRDLDGLPRRLNQIPVVIRPNAAACAAGTRVEWDLDGHALAARGCPLRVAVAAGRLHRLELRVGARRAVRTFRAVDRLVVAIGDSVASGEGNPAGEAQWLERRCHRSAAAGFEQAARLLAQANTAISLTFVSLACSGATIAEGLLGPYRGIESARDAPPLSPQVSRLHTIAGVRRVDALLVSVGANDVHFGDIVRHCLAVLNCPSSRFDPDHGGGNPDTDTAVGLALARLPGRYDELAGALGGAVAPSRVVVSEYFDPTRAADGRPCRAILGGQVTRSELRWAEDAVLTPLDQEVAAAAHRHGWQAAVGISRDFARHGYCTSRADRWVRTAPESLAELDGTLHPNRRGHLAIADRVAPVLAGILALAPPPKAAKEGGGGHGWLILLAVLAALLAAALLALAPTRRGLAAWARRIAYLPRRSGGRDPVAGAAVAPQLPRMAPEGGAGITELLELVVKAAGLLVAAVVSLGFVAFVGAAVEWVRFWAARYPADQAVDAVSREELLVIGAQALLLFGILGGAAVVVMWLLDGQGKAIRTTRRALAVLIVVELVAALLLGEYRLRQARDLVLGFVIGAVLLLFVVETALRATRGLRGQPPGRAVTAVLSRYFRPPLAGWSWSALPRRLWQLAPLALLGLALSAAIHADHAVDRVAVTLAPAVLAWVLFVAPGGVGAHATEARDPRLRPLRAAVAAALLACLIVLLARDELWLAGAAVAAIALAGFALIVASASGRRFLPFAATVWFAVGAYGAIVTCLRIIDAPQAQPVALLTDDGRAVCGVWVGDAGGRIQIGHVELSELGAHRRPRPRRSSLTSFSKDSIVDRSLGPLQPIGVAQDRAAALRDALEAEHPKTSWRDTGPTCERHPPAPHVAQTSLRRLAERVQPELVVDRRDGFWPVSVRTLFAMEDRRARLCRHVAAHTCVRLRSQGDLPWSGGEGEWLEYPADGLHTDDEHDLAVDALGSADPDATAREYFLVTRAAGPLAPWSIQYWFFYTFNYQPIASGRAGYHEGDFESVGLILSARSHRPRYVWMARHSGEGRVFSFDEDAVQRLAGRLVVFAAKGSHADYETCLRQTRIKAPAGLIDDRPQCDPGRQLRLAPEATPLTDLSRVAWACWHGRYGHHPGGGVIERVPYEAADGPLGPLWQQDFGGVSAQPCRGVSDPGPRDGRGEEVLPAATAARLRQGAGRLDPLIDSCGDWEQPVNSGSYLVACDPAQLRRYLDSGLEDPGPTALRIDVADPDHPSVGRPTVPAVRRNARLRRVDDWRLTASGATTAGVYVSCQAGKGTLEARFVAVRFAPDQPLRVDDRDRAAWRLRNENGATVATARPHVVRPLRKGARVACG